MARSSATTQWIGSVPKTVFAIRMKAGFRYVIRRDFVTDMGSTGRLVVLAQEEAPTGAVAPLEPARSPDEIQECREHEHDAS